MESLNRGNKDLMEDHMAKKWKSSLESCGRVAARRVDRSPMICWSLPVAEVRPGDPLWDVTDETRPVHQLDDFESEKKFSGLISEGA
jgi:hypothetical protein